MIPAKKNRWVTAWFRGYVRRYLRGSFHRIFFDGPQPAAPKGPLIVCINHSSWWDLLLAFWLSEDVLGWDAYGPMDERQLRRYPMLEGMGVFGVDRESLAGAREFLTYAQALLQGEQRALWMTAQGAIVSNELRPIRLYSGVARLAQALGRCAVTTIVLDYEFWDDRRPEAFVSFGPVREVEIVTTADVHALTHDLGAQLEVQLDALAARRRPRDPRLFHPALAASGGISPTYDLLRRCGAALSGRPWRPEHGAVATPPRWGPGHPRGE